MTKDEWNQAFKAEAANLLNYFVFRVHDLDRAEELYAKTVELAWRKRRLFQRSRGTLGAWLIGIGKRVYADEIRYRQRVETVEPLCDVADERSMLPDRAAIRTFQADAVRSAIADLPDRVREVVAMKWGAGLTNRNIAELLGISESNVGTTAARAIQKIRSRLEREDWNDVG